MAALVVAAVLVGGWWLTQPRPGAGGGVAAGEPGPVDHAADPGNDQQAIGGGPVLDKGAVRVDSYVGRGQRLVVTYTSGVPECYGEVAVGEVEERGDAVVVTLRAVPPAEPAEQCIDLAVTGTLAIHLAAPLGDRHVLDGGFRPEVLVRPAERPHGGLDGESGGTNS
jgi:hypothetical protein